MDQLIPSATEWTDKLTDFFFGVDARTFLGELFIFMPL